MSGRLKLFAMLLVAASVMVVGQSSIRAQGTNETLDRFYQTVPGAKSLLSRAAGVLVFPTVVRAGVGIGGEYGEGDLFVGGRPAGRYNMISASVGFQLGAEARSVIIVFMTPYAIDQFRQTDGWKVGVDASVAIITVGAGASVDSERITSPVVGFIIDPKGLMYNLTLEGSKISRIR